MCKTRRWSMIKRILRNKNNILISLDEGEFDYFVSGKSLMFNQLFMRLQSFVPKWHAARKGLLNLKATAADLEKVTELGQMVEEDKNGD